jgi:antitoxin component YwqK of YwqJK toxin-antitoxin module
MAMVFTERPVRLLSSFLLFCLFACNNIKQPENFPLLNAESADISNRNGTRMYQNKPFNGTLFTLHQNQKDTLSIQTYRNGLPHGTWTHFYPNGRLQETRSFRDGVKTDTLKRWWENGHLQLLCTFQNGEYEGALKEWNQNGQLIKHMHYKNGYESGKQQVFYDNGKIKSNYVIKNGKRIGLLGTKNCVNVSDSLISK